MSGLKIMRKVPTPWKDVFSWIGTKEIQQEIPNKFSCEVEFEVAP